MYSIKVVLEVLKKNDIQFEFRGDEACEITGFSSVERYKNNTITWIKNSKYVNGLMGHSICCAIVREALEEFVDNCIVVANPKEAFFCVIDNLWGGKTTKHDIDCSAYISENAVLGENVSVGRNCYIDGDVIIGDRTIIGNNVTILGKVRIGSDCFFASGAVIGCDGGGFAFDMNKIPKRIRHFGGVAIGSRVEVGPNSVVDKGTIDDTIICDDVKITSLVQIGHNSVLGKGCLVLSGAIICGSVEIGEKSYIAPGAVVKNHSRLGKNSFVGINAVSNKDSDDNSMIYSDEYNSIVFPDYRVLL